MLQSFAKYLTDTLSRHCPLSPQKRPIFQYGFEITTSTLSSAFSILLISIFLRDVLSACLFLGIFFFLRLFAGGYHAPTYARCFILTNSVYLMVYLVSRVFIAFQSTIPAIVLTLLSGLIIFAFSPIRNKKHPISEMVYRKNRDIARILVTLEALVLTSLILLRCDFTYTSVPIVSLAAVAVMMIISKFQERSE